MDSLKKLREPAAFIVLGALTVRWLVGLVTFGLRAANERSGSVSTAAGSVAGWITDPLAAAILAGLVASCAVWHQTPRSRLLSLLALVVIASGVVVSAVLEVIGRAGSDGGNWMPDSLLFLTQLAVPVVAVLFLYRLFQCLPAPNRVRAISSGAAQHSPAADGRSQHELGAEPAAAESGSDQARAESERLEQPTWQPDQAAGAAWTTAGDAAAGAAASGWGTPGEAGGWTPAPRQVDPPVEQEAPAESSSPRSPGADS